MFLRCCEVTLPPLLSLQYAYSDSHRLCRTIFKFFITSPEAGMCNLSTHCFAQKWASLYLAASSSSSRLPRPVASTYYFQFFPPNQCWIVVREHSSCQLRTQTHQKQSCWCEKKPLSSPMMQLCTERVMDRHVKPYVGNYPKQPSTTFNQS